MVCIVWHVYQKENTLPFWSETSLRLVYHSWVTLALRSVEVPTYERYVTHLVPFSLLFVAWVFIFFLAGLYANTHG